jgi:hypothetical protein
MFFRLLLVLSVMAFSSGDVYAQSSSVTQDDVWAMMTRLEGPEGRPVGVGHYECGPSSRALAKAIAGLAHDRREAALAVVFAAYESGNDSRAVGDGGKSHGAYQLRYVSREIAYDPEASTRVWLWLEREAMAKCPDLPEDERLARVMSGNCAAGRAKSRKRAEMASRLTSQAPPLDDRAELR